jgi:hypothetical protein
VSPESVGDTPGAVVPGTKRSEPDGSDIRVLLPALPRGCQGERRGGPAVNSRQSTR